MTKVEVVSQVNLENIRRVMKKVQTTHRRKAFRESKNTASFMIFKGPKEEEERLVFSS